MELGLQIAIGAPLMAARGWSHPENEQTYARARELASQIGESPDLPQVLAGMADGYVTKGDLATSALIAQEALAAAERTGGMRQVSTCRWRPQRLAGKIETRGAV